GSVAAGGGSPRVGLLLSQLIAGQNNSLAFFMAGKNPPPPRGVWGGPLTPLLCLVASNFFFFSPPYTLTLASPPPHLPSFFFFFWILALTVSNLTARTRSQMVTARSREKTTAELYAFSRKVAGIGALDDLLWATAYQISSMLKVRTVLLMPAREGEGLEVATG